MLKIEVDIKDCAFFISETINTANRLYEDIYLYKRAPFGEEEASLYLNRCREYKRLTGILDILNISNWRKHKDCELKGTDINIV